MKRYLFLGGVCIAFILAACSSQPVEIEETNQEETAPTATVVTPQPTETPQPTPIIMPLMKRDGLETIPSETLLNDADILYQALDSLHPGLYRHIDRSALDAQYAELQATFGSDLTLPQAYLAISKFLGTIQDGHTYANFYNQNAQVLNFVFSGSDKLPFYFRIVDNRMIVTESAIDIDAGSLERGTEIVAINGIPIAEILETMLPYVKADGGNDLKRIYDLQITGIPEYEWFDIFYPLLYPSTAEEFPFEIDAINPDGSQFTFQTNGVKRGWREKQIENRYEAPLADPNELWAFEIVNDDVAVLRMRTFATWNSDLDWEVFLADSFQALNEAEIPNLIIDIRGNEGGLDIIPATVDTYISPLPLNESFPNAFVAYETVPEGIDPYLNSWDDGLKDISTEVEPFDERLFQFVENDRSRYTSAFGNNPDLYSGQVYLLVDGGNSSATFLWGKSWRDSGLGTIAGDQTGGNMRGTTGGWFFQLELPGSGIEVDIPLIASFPAESLRNVPDEGLVPDILIPATAEGIKNGIDGQLNELINLITAEEG